MATAYITEYEIQTIDGLDRTAPVAKQPALVEQTVAIGGSSAASAAFGSRTRLVRINVDAACSFTFGLTPVATTSLGRLSAGATEYFGVIPGHAVAVISNA